MLRSLVRSRPLGSFAVLALYAYPLPLALAAAAPAHAQQLHAAPSASADGPSMKETAGWLTAHLTGQAADYVQVRSRVDAARPDGSRQFLGHRGSAQPEVLEVKETITSAALDGCHLTLTADRITTGPGTRTSRETQFMVPLEQVDDAYLGELEHQPERSAGVVETFMPKTTNILHIGAAQPVIAFTTHTSTVVIDKTTTTTSDAGTYHLIELPSDDTGLAERTVLALRHAINLCHTSLKPEPF